MLYKRRSILQRPVLNINERFPQHPQIRSNFKMKEKPEDYKKTVPNLSAFF